MRELANYFLAATVLALILSPFIWVGIEIWTAPIGYEDETGFHLGENPNAKSDD